MKIRVCLLAVSAVTVGLTAGVMFCYQIAIMPGIGRLPDREFVHAFQSIDQEIVDPAFVLVAFLGGAVSLIAATATHRQQPRSLRFRLLVAATCVYVVGVVVVTLAGHVPKNEELADFPVASSTAQEAAAARDDFEDSWNRLHALRTSAAVASFGLVVGSLVAEPRRGARRDDAGPVLPTTQSSRA